MEIVLTLRGSGSEKRTAKKHLQDGRTKAAKNCFTPSYDSIEQFFSTVKSRPTSGSRAITFESKKTCILVL